MEWLKVLKAAQEILSVGVAVVGEIDKSHTEPVDPSHLAEVSVETVTAIKHIADLLK